MQARATDQLAKVACLYAHSPSSSAASRSVAQTVLRWLKKSINSRLQYNTESSTVVHTNTPHATPTPLRTAQGQLVQSGCGDRCESAGTVELYAVGVEGRSACPAWDGRTPHLSSSSVHIGCIKLHVHVEVKILNRHSQAHQSSVIPRGQHTTPSHR